MKKFLQDFAAEECAEGFAKWIKRLKKCIEVHGDYVKKLGMEQRFQRCITLNQ